MAYTASVFSQVSDVNQLAELISEEFAKIEDEMASAQGGATLIHELAVTPGVANIVPSVITAWDDARPNRDFRAVVPDLLNNQIIAARAGQYIANFTVTAEIGLNRSYEVRLYLNGNPTSLVAFNEPSNQTDVVTMVATGSARVPREGERTVLDLRVSADQDAAQFDIRPSFFSVSWVGD